MHLMPHPDPPRVQVKAHVVIDTPLQTDVALNAYLLVPERLFAALGTGLLAGRTPTSS